MREMHKLKCKVCKRKQKYQMELFLFVMSFAKGFGADE